jgi:hypothetical protein
MRNLLVVVMSCILGLFVIGCGADPIEQTDHGFTLDDSGRVTPVDSSSLDLSNADPFEQSEGAKGEANLAESCSGSCTDTTCSCYGTYECCRAGCNACWEHRDRLQ